MKLLEINSCRTLLQENYWGHLAYIRDDKPFVVPITYYYDMIDNAIIAYSAPGHKIDSLKIKPKVCFQVDHVISMNKWKSVLVHGLFAELHGTEAKYELHKFAEGVKKIINERENKNSRFISEFTNNVYSKGVMVVYRIIIMEITGRQKDI